MITPIAAYAQATGGWLTEADLLAHEARWVEPLRTSWRGWTLVGMGRPTQGVCALEALAILEPLEADVHGSIEALKLAFADVYATIGDPRHGGDPARLLEPAYIAARRARLGPVAGPSPAPPGIDGGTVLMCAVDDGGMSASVIQSNFNGFGSGLVVPGTGIALQNRGAGFTFERGHPNEVGAGKQPFHTLLPGLIGTPHGVGAFGCMGGQMQPQGHVQLVTALHSGVSAQEAVDAKRWRWLDDGRVALEHGFTATDAGRRRADDLERRGHRVVRDASPWLFGGAQVLLPTERGWDAGSDPRKDGGVLWC
ncbi:MAG: gamma-glutamyltransferase [Myxococcota bacterium]